MAVKINTLFFLIAASALIACQPKGPKSNDDRNFECIAANLTVGGKMLSTVIQWNTKTGTTRIIDSTTSVSKTGEQNIAVGWIQLGDLQNAVQEMLARQQAKQQQAAPLEVVNPEELGKNKVSNFNKSKK